MSRATVTKPVRPIDLVLRPYALGLDVPVAQQHLVGLQLDVAARGADRIDERTIARHAGIMRKMARSSGRGARAHLAADP